MDILPSLSATFAASSSSSGKFTVDKWAFMPSRAEQWLTLGVGMALTLACLVAFMKICGFIYKSSWAAAWRWLSYGVSAMTLLMLAFLLVNTVTDASKTPFIAPLYVHNDNEERVREQFHVQSGLDLLPVEDEDFPLATLRTGGTRTMGAKASDGSLQQCLFLREEQEGTYSYTCGGAAPASAKD